MMIKKELSPKQQAIELIRASNNFLILTHVRPDGDALASSLAFKMVLEKMGKRVDLVVPDPISEDFNFLPGMNTIEEDISVNRDLVISIKNNHGTVGKITYNKRNDKIVDLVVSPLEGEIRQDDISLHFGKFNYDVLIVLDSTDLERISKVYSENKTALQSIPIINIDHHVTNNNFGDINIVDVSATSTCELIFSFIESIDKTFIESEVATLLLAGIISDTDRFQNGNTTPKSLTVSAQLIATGARRTEIITNVFKTHPVSTLKLWGKILSNVKEDRDAKIVWSTVSYNEIQEVNSTEGETSSVINELLSTVPDANVILLFAERSPGFIAVSMRTNSDKVLLDKIAMSFGGGGHRQAAGFKIENSTIENAERNVIARIKEHLTGSREKPVNPTKQTIFVENKKVEEKPFVVSERKVEQRTENRPEPMVERRADPNPESPKPTAVPEPVMPTINPNKKIEPDIEKEIREDMKKRNIVTEDDLYAHSLSDYELDTPNIVEDKTSILSKIISEKGKKKEDDTLDFAKMEAEMRRKNTPQAPDPFMDDEDEDYE